MRAVLEFHNHKWAFPLHFGNIEPSLQNLEDRKTAQRNLLENLRAKRNVRNIIFHHGISTHYCGLLWVSRRNFTTLWPQASNQWGLWQGPSPSGGMWRVSGVTVQATQECRLLWVCDANPPKPSSNFSVLGWAVSEKLIFLCSLSNICLLPLSKNVSPVPRLGLPENQFLGNISLPKTSIRMGKAISHPSVAPWSQTKKERKEP